MSSGRIGALTCGTPQLFEEQTPDSAVVREWLDGVRALLEQPDGQLRASVADWQELLPADYQELQRAQQVADEISAMQQQITALQETAEAQAAAAEEAGTQAVDVQQVRTTIARLEAEVAGLRTEQAKRPGFAAGGARGHLTLSGSPMLAGEGTLSVGRATAGSAPAGDSVVAEVLRRIENDKRRNDPPTPQ